MIDDTPPSLADLYHRRNAINAIISERSAAFHRRHPSTWITRIGIVVIVLAFTAGAHFHMRNADMVVSWSAPIVLMAWLWYHNARKTFDERMSPLYVELTNVSNEIAIRHKTVRM